MVHERCCGLDVHKKTVVACIMITLPTGEVQKNIRTFSTMTAGLMAAMALAHQLLVIIYQVLATKKPSHELGADYFEQRDRAHLTQRAVRQLEALGYTVTLAS